MTMSCNVILHSSPLTHEPTEKTSIPELYSQEAAVWNVSGLSHNLPFFHNFFFVWILNPATNFSPNVIPIFSEKMLGNTQPARRIFQVGNQPLIDAQSEDRFP